MPTIEPIDDFTFWDGASWSLLDMGVSCAVVWAEVTVTTNFSVSIQGFPPGGEFWQIIVSESIIAEEGGTITLSAAVQASDFEFVRVQTNVFSVNQAYVTFCPCAAVGGWRVGII